MKRFSRAGSRLQPKWVVLGLLAAVAFGAWPALPGYGAEGNKPIWIAQLVRRIPRTHEELAKAHAKSRHASIQVPIGQSIEIRDFAGRTTYDVVVRRDGKKQKQKLNYEFSRLGVLTYGMNLLPEDRASLPVVSKNRILDRVDGNYIAISVRVQREPTSGAVYLYYKPFAAVGHYHRKGTQEFSALMEDSVRDMRGIGLFVPKGTPISAETLRTFVAINKNVVEVKDEESGQMVLKPHYELLFVRARVDDAGHVALHAFGTNKHRQQLNYLKPFTLPRSRDECTIESTIFFTKYTAAKQSPAEKAARKLELRARQRFAMSELDAYVAQQGLEGDALDHLTRVLDDIIDGKIEPRAVAEASAQ